MPLRRPCAWFEHDMARPHFGQPADRREAAPPAAFDRFVERRRIAGRIALRDGIEVDLGHRGNMTDAIELAKALIAAPSVTPATGPVFDVLETALLAQGFEVERFVVGEEPDGPVENLLATRGQGGEHCAFAGHRDGVPPGEGWTADAFAPEVKGDLLYGRGAVD